MKDVTEHAKWLGYAGKCPVLVRDGYVVSPFRKYYPDFCHDLRQEQLRKELEPGVEVTGYSIHGTSDVGEVVSIRGNNVKVFWRGKGFTSTEWISDLQPVRRHLSVEPA